MQILVTCCGSLLLLALVESGDLLNDRPTADLAKRPLEHPPPPAGLLPFVDESKDGTPEQIGTKITSKIPTETQKIRKTRKAESLATKKSKSSKKSSKNRKIRRKKKQLKREQQNIATKQQNKTKQKIRKQRVSAIDEKFENLTEKFDSQAKDSLQDVIAKILESFGKNLPEQVDSAAKKTFDALEKGGKSRKTTIFIPKHLVNSSSTGKLQRKVKELRKKKRNLIVKSSVLDPVSSTLAYTRNKRKRGNRTPFGNRGQATVVAKLNALLKGDKARVAEKLNGGKATVPMAKAPPLTVLPFSSQNHINEPTISHRSIGGKRRKFPIRIIPQRTTVATQQTTVPFEKSVKNPAILSKTRLKSDSTVLPYSTSVTESLSDRNATATSALNNAVPKISLKDKATVTLKTDSENRDSTTVTRDSTTVTHDPTTVTGLKRDPVTVPFEKSFKKSASPLDELIRRKRDLQVQAAQTFSGGTVDVNEHSFTDQEVHSFFAESFEGTTVAPVSTVTFESVVDPEEKILEYTTSVTTLGVTSPGLELPEYPDDITETSTVAGTLASTSGTLETTNTVTQMATEPATTLWTTVTPVLPINNRETLAELVSIKANDGQGTQATVGTQESTGIGREGTVTTQDPFSDSIFFPEITIQPPIEISDNEPTTTTATPNTGFFGVTVNPPSDDQLAEAEKIVKIKEERRKVEEEEYYRTSTEPTSAATVVSTVLDRDAEGGIVEAQGAAQEGTVADGGIGRGLEGTVMGQEGTVATEEGTVGGQSSTTEKLEPYTGTTVEPTLYKVFGDINDDLENANFVGKFSLQEDPEELQKEIVGIVKAVQPALESNGSVVILEADVRGIDENLAPNLVVKQVNKALKKVKKLRRKKIKNAEISTGDKQGHQIPLQAGAGAGAGQVLQVPLQVSAGASPGAGQVHQALQVPLQARSTVAGQAKSLQPQPGAGQIQHLRQIPTVSGTVRSSQQLRQVPLPPAYVQQQLQPVPLPSTGAEPVRPGPHSLPRFWNYQLQQQQQPQQHWAYYQPLGQQVQPVLQPPQQALPVQQVQLQVLQVPQQVQPQSHQLYTQAQVQQGWPQQQQFLSTRFETQPVQQVQQGQQILQVKQLEQAPQPHHPSHQLQTSTPYSNSRAEKTKSSHFISTREIESKSGKSHYRPPTSQQAQEVLAIIKELKKAQGSSKKPQSFSVFTTTKQSYFILPNGRVLVVAEESRLAKHRLDDEDKVVEAPRGKRMLFEPERKKLDGESGYDEVKIHDGSLSPEEIEARQLEGEIEKKMRATFGDEAIDSVSPLSLHAFRSSTEIPTRHLQSNGGTDEQLLTESDNPLDSESFPIPQEKFPMPSRPPPSRTIISGGHPGSPTQHQNQNRRKFQLRLVSLYNKH